MKKETTLSTIAPEKELTPIEAQINTLEITDPTTMKEAVSYLSQVNSYLDKVIEWKENKTTPLNALLKTIRGETKPLETRLEALVSELRGKMSEYQTDMEAKRKEEESKIAERVKSGKGNLSVESAVKKIDALETVEKKVDTEAGTVKFRTVKRFEIVSISEVPMEYHVIDEVAIRKAMLAGTEVKGVRYYETQEATNFR